MASSASIRKLYGAPLFGVPDPVLKRCLVISGALGLVVLVAAHLAPVQPVEISSVDQVPERIAKLILEEPAAAAPPEILARPEPTIARETKPEPIPEPPPVAPRRAQKKETLPASRGEAGREMARNEVSQQLQDVKGSLDRVLSDLTTSLSSSEDGEEKRTPRSRRRKTRSGRSASQLAGVGRTLAGLDVPSAGSNLSGARIEIESVGAIAGEDSRPGEGEVEGEGTGSASEFRSNASLLAVVRRYAPGIQFCYDNELKKKPGLGGKLLVGITVAPSGRVTDVVLVRDTVGSAGLVSCALAQIEAWKFPPISEGVVTFQAPFVFTPPE